MKADNAPKAASNLPPAAAWTGLGICLVILASCSALALSLGATWDNSATVDEFAHLPAGVYYWRTGDFSLYDLNPPFSRLMAALPVMTMSPRLDLTPETIRRANLDPWGVGGEFLKENSQRYDRMLFWGRLPIALCGAALVGLIGWWSWRLFGWLGGALSAIAAALCPNLLAHAGLVTPDIPLTLFWTATLFVLWRTARGPSWKWTVAGAVFLALALLTKYTALILLGAIPFTMALAGFVVGGAKPKDAPPFWDWRPLARSLVLIVAALVLVGGFYGFRGFLTPPGDSMQSRMMKALSWAPMPLPAAYVRGFDRELVLVEVGDVESYLNGECYRGSRWYYYPEALLLKVPGPTLALIALAILAGCSALSRPGPAFVILAASTSLFLLVNMFFGNLNIGLRYILPIFPAIFIGLGVLADAGRWLRARLAASCVLIVFLAVAVVGSSPHYISYFNQFAGGRDGGPRYLLDSNVDWGQDLKRLARYLRENDVDSVQLAYFGYVPLERYDVHVLPGAPTPRTKGWVAVSAQYLYRMPLGKFGPGDCAWLKDRKPVARIGGSIYVYHLEGQAQ